MLEVPFEFQYTNSMKNKNTVTDRTVKELVDLIIEIQTKRNNKAHAYAYALGAVQSILDWELKGFNYGSLQETINDQYTSYKAELKALEKEDRTVQSLQKVANKAKLEDLYA
jgi:flagellar motility protein MotE (MotC chaperone)